MGEAPAGAFPFFDTTTYTGPLYVLDFEPGTPDDFVAVVPAANGHYSNPSDWPAGAQFQTEVAPSQGDVRRRREGAAACGPFAHPARCI